LVANIVADHNAKIDLYTKSYYTALIDNWRQQLRSLNKTTSGPAEALKTIKPFDAIF